MRVDNAVTTNITNTTGSASNSAPAAVSRPDSNMEVFAEHKELKLTNEKERLEEAIAHANKALEGSHRSFKYEIHEPTNAVIISVIDDKTSEVLSEIPARKLLDVVSKLMELAGLVVDERR